MTLNKHFKPLDTSQKKEDKRLEKEDHETDHDRPIPEEMFYDFSYNIDMQLANKPFYKWKELKDEIVNEFSMFVLRTYNLSGVSDSVMDIDEKKDIAKTIMAKKYLNRGALPEKFGKVDVGTIVSTIKRRPFSSRDITDMIEDVYSTYKEPTHKEFKNAIFDYYDKK